MAGDGGAPKLARREPQQKQQQQQQRVSRLRLAPAAVVVWLLLLALLLQLAPVAVAAGAHSWRSASSAGGRRLLLEQQQRRQQHEAEAAAAACERLDPEGDYSVWEAPSYGYWTRQLPHEQYLENNPEQWRRNMYAGTGFWNARGLDTPGYIRAMLGDALAPYESPNRTDQIRAYLYPGDDDKWSPLAADNYARFYDWRWPQLLQQVKPAPGLSEAAAACRARAFMDRYFLDMTRGNEGHARGSLFTSGLDEGHDTVYTTVWRQATISPFPYGPSSVTFYPDAQHRAVNLRQWGSQFANFTSQAYPYWDCVDLGESQTPGYLPADMVAAYEIRDKAFRMYPNESLDNTWPTHKANSLPVAVKLGMYKVKLQCMRYPSPLLVGMLLMVQAFDAYMGLEHVLLVDGLVDVHDPTYCIDADAAGRLMVCDFAHMLWCDDDVSRDTHPHHTVLTDRPANVVGVAFATPAAAGDAVSNAIAKVRWCAAAQVLHTRTSEQSRRLPAEYIVPAVARAAVEAAVFADKSMKAQLLSIGETGWTDLTTCHQVLQGVQSSGLGVQALWPSSSFAQRLRPDVLRQTHATLLDLLSGSARHQL
eukprot:jgi/Chlat1/3177/Chrsp22S03455